MHALWCGRIAGASDASYRVQLAGCGRDRSARSAHCVVLKDQLSVPSRDELVCNTPGVRGTQLRAEVETTETCGSGSGV